MHAVVQRTDPTLTRAVLPAGSGGAAASVAEPVCVADALPDTVDVALGVAVLVAVLDDDPDTVDVTLGVVLGVAVLDEDPDAVDVEVENHRAQRTSGDGSGKKFLSPFFVTYPYVTILNSCRW